MLLRIGRYMKLGSGDQAEQDRNVPKYIYINGPLIRSIAEIIGFTRFTTNF